MKCFQSVQARLEILGFKSGQRRFNKEMLTTFLCFGSNIFCNVVYLFRGATNFRQYIESSYLTCSTITVGAGYTIFVLKIDDLFDFIESVSEMIDERSKSPAMKAIYDSTNGKVEMMCEISHYVVGRFLPLALIVGKFIVNLFVYFTTDMEQDEFPLPFITWFPFDTKNPFGYSVAVIVEYIIVNFEFLYISSMLSFGVGSFFFGIAVQKDLTESLKEIKDSPKNKQTIPQSVAQLVDFIQIHSMAKEVFQKAADLYGLLFATVFVWSLITICGAMLLIEMEISKPEINLIVLLEAIIYNAVAFSLSFAICELCQRLTNILDEVCDFFDQFEWYLFPAEFQKMLPIVLIPVQESFVLNCFGSISCSRETFKKIANGGYSYYTVIRRFIK